MDVCDVRCSSSADDIDSNGDEVDNNRPPGQENSDEQPNNHQNLLLKDAFSDRKNLVRGLCDASLIAANVSQLRTVLDSDPDNKFYIPLLTLIGLSLLSHIVFGIIIIQMCREERKSESQHLEALKTPSKQKESQDQKSMPVSGRNLEAIVRDRIPCVNKTCTHCRRYQTYDDLSILVIFFLIVLNVAISGLGLPTLSQDC